MTNEELIGFFSIGFAILGGLLRLVWLASRQASAMEMIQKTLQTTILDNHAEHKEFYQRLDSHGQRLQRVEDYQQFRGNPGGS
jgi:hypothetical protein